MINALHRHQVNDIDASYTQNTGAIELLLAAHQNWHTDLDSHLSEIDDYAKTIEQLSEEVETLCGDGGAPAATVVDQYDGEESPSLDERKQNIEVLHIVPLTCMHAYVICEISLCPICRYYTLYYSTKYKNITVYKLHSKTVFSL